MIAYSLKDIRRAVGLELGDMVVLTATAAGTTTSLIDTKNLWLPDGVCKGRMLYFTDGTAANIGAKKTITGSSQSLGNVSWSVALGTATAANDVGELWNTRGIGWDPVNEVNAVINNALRKASAYAWIPGVASITTAFDQDTGTFTIPGGTRAIYAVEWQDDDDLWREVPKAKGIGQWGWSHARGTNKVAIAGDLASTVDTRTLRIRRYTDTSVLDADDDETEISFDYLLSDVVATLLGAAFDRSPNERGLFQRWQRAADEAHRKRDLIGGRPMSNVVLVE